MKEWEAGTVKEGKEERMKERKTEGRTYRRENQAKRNCERRKYGNDNNKK